MLDQLGQTRIIITNFHALALHEKVAAGKLTKAILAGGAAGDGGTAGALTETPEQMVRRVCRELGGKKNIIVINDEAHHCYRRKPDGEDERLSGDERAEAKQREEEARVWISGIEAVKTKIGVRAIYDLSATPFFLRGSGYAEGTLFPWVVSDFSLIDAIEAGIVKVPRVPVADDAMTGEQPTYRDLWLRIRDDLPKKGRKTEALKGEPVLPLELQGALHSLYSNYEKYYRLWEENGEARARGITPPVFIVVCNNTNVSKLVFDYVSGWEKQIGERAVAQAGQLPLFRNDDGNGGWLDRPNTILVDSQQLESGGAMSDEFKQVAAREIEEFKAEYRQRFPGRDADGLTDEDLLREVMNTVGKAGRLGNRCAAWSVSPCSPRAGTPTRDAHPGRARLWHAIALRAGGGPRAAADELRRQRRGPVRAGICRGLRSALSFIPCSGSTPNPVPGPMPTRVRALESRIDCEITFPRLLGYRYDLSGERLAAAFSEDSRLALSTADLPTQTENAPIVGRAASTPWTTCAATAPTRWPSAWPS
jgi:type III restriction enzyme